MPYDPALHHRGSYRLNGYDYTLSGAYFVTICTYQRQCLFGKIHDGEMTLNDLGMTVQAYWQRLPQHFSKLTLDALVVMPNHLHGILVIGDRSHLGELSLTLMEKREVCGHEAVGFNERHDQNASSLKPKLGLAQAQGAASGSVGAIVGNFKSVSTRQINRLRNTKGKPVWQRNYHDHIIRDEAALNRIRSYIVANPRLWQADRLHSQ